MPARAPAECACAQEGFRTRGPRRRALAAAAEGNADAHDDQRVLCRGGARAAPRDGRGLVIAGHPSRARRASRHAEHRPFRDRARRRAPGTRATPRVPGPLAHAGGRPRVRHASSRYARGAQPAKCGADGDPRLRLYDAGGSDYDERGATSSHHGSRRVACARGAMSHKTTMRVIDSHTGGEPTRVIIEGGPDLGSGPIAARRDRFRDRFDRFRTATTREPRASDVVVGALLVPPEDARSTAGVIFFNNVGYLGMCGHGTIGVVATLAYLKRIAPGVHRIDTPVGTVTTELHANGSVSVTNVASWRAAKDVHVDVPDIGTVVGDVAYGGNWFFLTEQHGHALSSTSTDALSDYARRVRAALNAKGHPEVDHVELFG